MRSTVKRADTAARQGIVTLLVTENPGAALAAAARALVVRELFLQEAHRLPLPFSCDAGHSAVR